MIVVKVYNRRTGGLQERTFDTMIEAQGTLTKHGFRPLPGFDKIWEHEKWFARVDEKAQG